MSISLGKESGAWKRFWDAFVWILTSVRGSFINFVVAIGIIFLLLAVVTEGQMAGFFGIWGVSAMVYAAVGEALMRLIGYKG